MMKYVLFILIPICSFGQPNCNVYLYNKDTLQYDACKYVEYVPFYQYSNQYQERFDKALEICPYFAYAYEAKSTAYLKSGDFLTWKYLIDKAVEYDTLSNIGYRGWCRYQFFRDYKGAIEDIEYLETKYNSLNVGYSAGGEYHLIVAKAICYSALNEKKKAIDILEKLFTTKDYVAGLFDYYQLAITYFQIGDYKNASKYLDRQSEINEIAENIYYKAKIAKILGNTELYASEKERAIQLYNDGKNLFDPYTEHFNKVYLTTIIND
jgi:tetratricopeptide (TPR) repeat protein